ncbi:MAG TPA: glycosyltransferase [Solirubrobacteraceae bacterium]|nr:glycosyltransferase [Solirubrobacteraceae bacterium]
MANRPRLALVTPWPPEQSGIADYAELLSAPLSRIVDVDVITAGPPVEYTPPRADGVRLRGACEPGLGESLSAYDRVVYCLGNSRFHLHALELLRRHPGVVHFHDVQLTGLYFCLAAATSPERPHAALIERIEQTYAGELPDGAFEQGLPDWGQLAALGVLMTREIRARAERSFVHSRYALGMLDEDSGRLARGPATVLPFAMPEVAGAGSQPVDVGSDPLILHLGVVNPIKGIASLIDAFALVAERRPRAQLVIAGPIDDGDRQHWEAYASEQAPGARIEITGHIERERYSRLLGQAAVAVQLRSVATGEASGAIADCLAAGLPMIVSDLGWAGELPADAVVRVPVGADAVLIAERVEGLLGDRESRAKLAAAARGHATASSFERVADAYLEALELR